jgi:Fic family protein
MADSKMTKKDWFEVIKGIVEASNSDQKDGAVEFIDKQVEALAAKAEKAKERAQKNKEAGDELRAKVQAVLTDELQTIDEITAQVDVEDVTKAKVTARLTQLVKAGIAAKDTVKTEDKRKITAYRLATETEDAE